MRSSMNDVFHGSIRMVFLSILWGCFSGCRDQVAGPRAIVEPAEVTIETSSSDPDKRIEFRIRNIGSETFTLPHVSASCGCTSAEVQPKIVKPGSEAVLIATVSSINTGTRRVAVESVTDIPDQPSLSVFINTQGKGKVPYISSNSDLITFGTDAKLGDIENFYVESQEAASEQPWLNMPVLELAGIEVGGGLAKETSVGNGVVSRRYEYQARIAKALEIGEFRGHVVVTGHSDKARQEIRIPLQGLVPAPVIASPGAVFGTFSKFEDIPQYMISFRNVLGAKTMDIEPLATDPLRYSIEKVSDSTSLVKFRLRFPEKFGKELIDELVFRTGVAEMPEIRLPVRLRIRD